MKKRTTPKSLRLLEKHLPEKALRQATGFAIPPFFLTSGEESSGSFNYE
jgi:hypothetical protein